MLIDKDKALGLFPVTFILTFWMLASIWGSF
jgi:hypothetical protein